MSQNVLAEEQVKEQPDCVLSSKSVDHVICILGQSGGPEYVTDLAPAGSSYRANRPARDRHICHIYTTIWTIASKSTI